MAREEKVWEYAIEAGYAPLEDRCIIVKGAAGDLSEKIVRFFETWDVAVLQMCENELILLPFDYPLACRAACVHRNDIPQVLQDGADAAVKSLLQGL